MMHYITDPFQFVFIQRAAMAGILIGVLCAAWGTFIVLRRMSLVGHALSHSALPGLVMAFMLQGNLLLGAFVSVMLTAIFMGVISRNDRVPEDTAAGIIPNVMFAIGILLISMTKSYRDLFAMLFGNILGVTHADLIAIAMITIAALFMLVLFYKELKLYAVDPDYAKAIGIPVDVLRYGLLVAVALTVVVGIQAVGTVLTNALLVIPVAAARLLTDQLGKMMLLSCIFAVTATLSGIYVSYYAGLSSGAAIVIVCAIIFATTWLLKKFDVL